MADQPANVFWVKKVIRKCKYIKIVSVILSYVCAMVFSVYLTEHLHEDGAPTSNDPETVAYLHESRLHAMVIVSCFYAVMCCLLVYIHGRCGLHKATCLKDLKDSHIFYRWFSDVLLIGAQVIADISCPLLSAYIGSRLEAEHIQVVAWFTMSLFFLCTAVSSIREYGAIDGGVAIMLGLLFVKTGAPELLAESIGLNYVENKKLVLIIFSAIIPALRRALLPTCKFLDEWGNSDDTFKKFMNKKYPKRTKLPVMEAKDKEPMPDHDIEMRGLLSRQFSSDSQLYDRVICDRCGNLMKMAVDEEILRSGAVPATSSSHVD